MVFRLHIRCYICLFSSKYQSCTILLCCNSLGSTIGIISTYASNLQIGYGDTRRFMYYQLLAVAIQIVLLFALTPLLGVNGVLLALFVISQILIDIIYVYALYRQFSFKHEFRPLLWTHNTISATPYTALRHDRIPAQQQMVSYNQPRCRGHPVPSFGSALWRRKREKNIEFVQRDIAKSLKCEFHSKSIYSDYASDSLSGKKEPN